MHRFKLSEILDKIFLLVAMIVFAWVGMRAVIGVRQLDSIAGQGRPLLSELKVNAPIYESEVSEVKEIVWSSPESQSRGEDWVFDVFTPPVIYYDPNTREFAVIPPTGAQETFVDGMWAAFDVELLEVRQKPYKLQLVGYAGNEGSYIAYFEKSSDNTLVYLSVGQEEGDLGVRLVGFSEQQIEIRNEDDTPVIQSVGVARLEDFESGQEISLTNTETKMFSALEAKVRLLPARLERFVQEGSRLELRSGDYLIEDLSAQPEAAIVTKISKDGDQRISRTLTPTISNETMPRGSRQEETPSSPFAIRPRLPSSQPEG
ncbi:hypothetical protein [Pelagicoccus albus]|uniref:Uncharacterized protein n=1 Tax=Pelagicoccus albus TaxID=415222 RepID=A0A7X1E7G0_9BACT|nr:hypothetical protein [Pelagicoccus albus]MBC2605254.1 hypothetical protein [Pelagicoccus albus]